MQGARNIVRFLKLPHSTNTSVNRIHTVTVLEKVEFFIVFPRAVTQMTVDQRQSSDQTVLLAFCLRTVYIPS